MKITFLGTSHGFCEKNQFCSSAVVTVGGRHYIIDAGAPITGLLKTYGMAYTDIAGCGSVGRSLPGGTRPWCAVPRDAPEGWLQRSQIW